METNISHTRGDTFKRTITIKDKNDTAIDITWSVITFSLKNKISDATFVLQSVATLTDPTNWIADIDISWASMNIDLKNYYFDIERVDALWQVITFLKWNFTIVYDITT